MSPPDWQRPGPMGRRGEPAVSDGESDAPDGRLAPPMELTEEEEVEEFPGNVERKSDAGRSHGGAMTSCR